MTAPGWDERSVAVGENRLHVRTLGDGDDLVVLLHGWPQDGSAWNAVAPRLVAAGYRVACPDLKGFGRSSAPRDGYDPATLAEEMARLVAALGCSRAVFVGHDWGGAVALATALRRPAAVRGLVVASFPYRHFALLRLSYIGLFNLPVLPEAAFRHFAEPLVRAVLRAAGAPADAIDDDAVRRYAEAVRVAPHGWLAYYRGLSRRMVRGRLSGARAPDDGGGSRVTAATMLIWGDRDPISTPDRIRADAQELHAQLVVLAGVGHFVADEAPEELSAALLRFLADL